MIKMEARQLDMAKDALDQAIYARFIEPTKRRHTKTVGVEFEYPIVNRAGDAVDFDAVHAAAEAFVRRFGMSEIQRDDSGAIYNAVSPENGDALSFDCSYNTVEFSFGKEEDINVLDLRFRDYYAFFYDELGKSGHTLTGMGINPNYRQNNNVPVASERYRMLLHHLSSYKKYGNIIPFHDVPYYGLISCASQVQLDVEYEDLAETLNTFNRLEPLKALLFANSPWGEGFETLCVRDAFWRNSTHGINPHNVDMHETELEDADEVAAYIRSMSLYCVERDGKYINFAPTPLARYFSSPVMEGEYFDGNAYQTISFAPMPGDLEYLRSFKFNDLTFRGTMEFRSVCEQPVSEAFASAAFHVGLMENRHSLSYLLSRDHSIYHNGYNAAELRRLFVKRELPEWLDRAEVSRLLLQILDLAEDGLSRRGLQEEHFLTPLYLRAERLESPAREIADSQAPLDEFVDRFGRISDV